MDRETETELIEVRVGDRNDVINVVPMHEARALAADRRVFVKLRRRDRWVLFERLYPEIVDLIGRLRGLA